MKLFSYLPSKSVPATATENDESAYGGSRPARAILAFGYFPAYAHAMWKVVWRPNAVVESFFISMKKERIKKRIYHTRELARADVFDYIEAF